MFEVMRLFDCPCHITIQTFIGVNLLGSWSGGS